MSLLFAYVVAKPIFSPRVLPHFSIWPQRQHFSTKISALFSLTHNLLKFYVYKVSSILVHSGLREKSVVSMAIINRVKSFREKAFRNTYKCTVSEFLFAVLVHKKRQ